MHQPLEYPFLIEVDLAETCRYAKRQQHIVKRFTADDATPWDLAHEYLNSLLTDWEAAR